MRHLPTLGNQKKQYIGWTDEPIVEVDHKYWKLPWDPAEVFCSDLLRAKQSAAIYFPNAVYKTDPRFRESNFGKWEGKTYAALKKNKTYQAWIDDPFNHKPPAGEKLEEIKTRVLAAFTQLPVSEKDTYLVIHGGPIRILLTHYSPENQPFWSWIIPHGSAWRFEWATVQDWKEGKKCASISEVPITANDNT